ncbi:hypothetical protein OROGR_024924 [Orobanche gracilis]
MAENSYDGLERGVLLQWLDDKPTKERFGFRVQQPRPRGVKLPSCVESNSPKMSQVQRHLGCGQRPQRKNQIKSASNGLGMQAMFLGPNSKPCGTGVFIPRTEGTAHEFSKKPAISPVLLPARVIRALNIDVHEFGQQIKAQTEPHGNIANKNDEKPRRKNKKKKGKKEDVIYISPDIILPKEWTY